MTTAMSRSAELVEFVGRIGCVSGRQGLGK